MEQDRQGIRPIYRPKDWNVTTRRKQKEKKKYEWSTKGGHIAPIFVPPTPNSELANSLKVIADEEAELGVHFKIVETGGLSMRAILQKSNPLQNIGCENADCLSLAPKVLATVLNIVFYWNRNPRVILVL